MVKLVEDLVPSIVDSTDCTSCLCNFALVSPSWLWPVRRQLYKHPTITSENQCRYLVRTLESVPDLQPLVFGLDLWLDDPPFAARGLSAVRVVLSLRNLQHVSFISPTATFLISKIHNHASIKRLCIFPDNHPLPRPAPLSQRRHMVEWEPKQVSKFTALAKLVLSGANLHITPPSTQASYPPNLTDLTLSRCTVPYGQTSQLLDPHAWGRIHTLTLILPREDSSIFGALSHCTDSLVRLHLQYDTPRSMAGAFVASRIFDALRAPGAAQLRALRTLRLVDVGPQLQRGRALRDIAVRCPGLTHLTISGHIATHMLCEWGWPVEVGTALPSLVEMAGPAQVVAPNGLRVSSKTIWEAARRIDNASQVQWKEESMVEGEW